MKRNMKWMSVLVAATLFFGLTGCNNEYLDLEYKGNIDFNQLVLKQARNVWNGAECNTTHEFKFDEENPVKNKECKLNLALYQDRVSAQDVTVDLTVNKDSLQTAIARADEGGLYAKYADVELLPEEYYTLQNGKLKLTANSKLSDDVSLTLYAPMLIEHIQNEVKADKTYVLPLTISNATAYAINEKVHTWMCFVKVAYVEKKKQESAE